MHHGAARSIIVDHEVVTRFKPDLCREEYRGPCHDAALPNQPHDFGLCCNTGAPYAIKQALWNGSNSILVSWEHANIVYLVKEMGYPGQLPYWPDIQYDIIYALYYDPHTLEFMTLDSKLLSLATPIVLVYF